jgi:hypothetical protein
VNKISTLICAAMIPCLAQAASIPYTDNFNADTPGTGTTPGTDVPAGWSISNGGSVDIVANGTYGPPPITCLGMTGNCIDLNGSTGKPGDLVSPGLSLTGGQTYTAQFYLSGNQRIRQTDTVTIDFGTTVASISVTQKDPFTLDSVTFTPTTTGIYNLSFLDTSNNPLFPGDNIGAILDTVKVQAVPLPAAAWLLLSGLASMGLMARRRSAA